MSEKSAEPRHDEDLDGVTGGAAAPPLGSTIGNTVGGIPGKLLPFSSQPPKQP
jgi:hypothetical protein